MNTVEGNQNHNYDVNSHVLAVSWWDLNIFYHITVLAKIIWWINLHLKHSSESLQVVYLITKHKLSAYLMKGISRQEGGEKGVKEGSEQMTPEC